MSKQKEQMDLQSEFEQVETSSLHETGDDSNITVDRDPGTAIAPTQAQRLVKFTPSDPSNLPNLDEAPDIGVDLVSTYWTPEEIGESRRMFFTHIAFDEYTDEESGEVINLECAYFIEMIDGVKVGISNGSTRLVSAIKSAVKNLGVEPFQAMEITYKGEQKNATNSYKSFTWSVHILNPEDESA